MALPSLDRAKLLLNDGIGIKDLILLVNNVDTIVHGIKDSFEFIPFELEDLLCLLALGQLFLPALHLFLCLDFYPFLTNDESGTDPKGQDNDPDQEQVLPQASVTKPVTLS